MSTQSEIMRFLLQGENKSLIDALNGAEAALTGTESAAERVTAQMKAMATVIETEGRQSAAAAEALAEALGPEIVANVERAGGSIQELVGDLNRAGVSFDEIRLKADMLADGIRQVDTAGRTVRISATDAASGVRTLGTEADQSRSVLANMVGNSAQDLGQLGGVAGSAGVMIGQLAEYAVDGNIKLSNLAKVAGPMAAVTAAGFGISMAMEAAAKRAEEAARKAAALRDIIEDLDSGDTGAAAEKLVVEYEKTIPILERFGYTAADVQATLEGSGLVFRGLADDMATLQEMRDELLNQKASVGYLSEEDQAQLDWVLQQLTDIDAVTNTLRNDQKEFANETTAWEDFNRRIGEVNESLKLNAGYWGDIGRAAAQAASVENDLADQDKAATTAANKLAALRTEVEAYIKSMGNIPEAEVTEIRAALDAGNISLVERLLANMTRPRIIDLIPVLASVKPAGTGVGKGSANAGSGAKGSRTPTYDPGSILAGLFDDDTGGGGGGGSGGGGGGGGGSSTEVEEDPMVAFDRAYSNLYGTGQASLTNYRAYLQDRLGAYASYSDEYKTIWDKLRALDAEEASAARDAAAAEKLKQDEAKKAVEEQRKLAESQLEALRELLDILTGFASADTGNLNGPSNIVGSGAAGSLDRMTILGLLAQGLQEYQDGVV